MEVAPWLSIRDKEFGEDWEMNLELPELDHLFTVDQKYTTAEFKFANAMWGRLAVPRACIMTRCGRLRVRRTEATLSVAALPA